MRAHTPILKYRHDGAGSSSNGRTRLAHLLNVKVSCSLFISQTLVYALARVISLHSVAEAKHYEIGRMRSEWGGRGGEFAE